MPADLTPEHLAPPLDMILSQVSACLADGADAPQISAAKWRVVLAEIAQLRARNAELEAENATLKAHRLSREGLDLSVLLGYEAGEEAAKQRIAELEGAVNEALSRSCAALAATPPVSSEGGEQP